MKIKIWQSGLGRCKLGSEGRYICGAVTAILTVTHTTVQRKKMLSSSTYNQDWDKLECNN